MINKNIKNKAKIITTINKFNNNQYQNKKVNCQKYKTIVYLIW